MSGTSAQLLSNHVCQHTENLARQSTVSQGAAAYNILRVCVFFNCFKAFLTCSVRVFLKAALPGKMLCEEETFFGIFICQKNLHVKPV